MQAGVERNSQQSHGELEGERDNSSVQEIDPLVEIGRHHSKKHILDNEYSNKVKEAIREHVVDYELVLKGQYRQNIAEKAIQTYKSHTIGVFLWFNDK